MFGKFEISISSRCCVGQRLVWITSRTTTSPSQIRFSSFLFIFSVGCAVASPYSDSFQFFFFFFLSSSSSYSDSRKGPLLSWFLLSILAFSFPQFSDLFMVGQHIQMEGSKENCVPRIPLIPSSNLQGWFVICCSFHFNI